MAEGKVYMQCNSYENPQPDVLRSKEISPQVISFEVVLIS